MVSIDVEFTRSLMAEAIKLVRKHFPGVKMRDAWVYKTGRGRWEFHGPGDGFYWHGRASTAYEARYKGWMAWLSQKGVEEAQ